MEMQDSPARNGRRLSNLLRWENCDLNNSRHNWIIPKRPTCLIVALDPSCLRSTESRYDTYSALVTVSLDTTSVYTHSPSLCKLNLTLHSLYTSHCTHSPPHSASHHIRQPFDCNRRIFSGHTRTMSLMPGIEEETGTLRVRQ